MTFVKPSLQPPLLVSILLVSKYNEDILRDIKSHKIIHVEGRIGSIVFVRMDCQFNSKIATMKLMGLIDSMH